VRRVVVTIVGTLPMFTNDEQILHVESQILYQNEKICGKVLNLAFVERLRPEQRFPSVEALVG